MITFAPIMLLHRFLSRNEKWIFYLVVCFNIIPVFAGKIFVTFDGSAHGYNVNILRDLLFNGGEIYGPYFKINYELVPNLLGHFILLGLTSFLPYFVAERILVASFLFFVPFLYRKIVLHYQPSNSLASFIIIPFTSYSLLYLGFYNFSIAIILMLVAILYWLKNKEQMTVKNYAVLFFVFLLVYFSHIFVFAITLLFIGLDLGINSLFNWFKEKTTRRRLVGRFFSIAGLLLLISSPFIALMLNYFSKRPNLGGDKFLTGSQIFKMLYNVQPLVTFKDDLQKYSVWFFYGLLCLLIVVITSRIKSRKFFEFRSDIWLLLSLIMIVFLFKFPDDDGYASFISIRFVVLFYVALLFWLSIQEIKSVWYVIIILVFSYPYLKLRKENRHAEKWFNLEVQKTMNVIDYVEENKTLVFANFSNNWFGGHFSNYLAIDKKIIVLENYEAYMGYFPVLWNGEKLNQFVLSDSLDVSCIKIPEGKPAAPKVKPDYVLVWGKSKENGCYLNLSLFLDTHYIQVYKKDDITLYKVKQNII